VGGSAWRAFFAELRRLGYIEGENLIIERYSAEGHHERYADLAQEIVSRNPDLIVTGTNPVVIAFKATTSTIPVVAFMLDPLKAGLVTSLARPGGNLTGITLDAGIEIWGKRCWNKPANAANILPPSGREMVAPGVVSFFPDAAFAKAKLMLRVDERR
jgi:putative ABC transport system substrate-binding protein